MVNPITKILAVILAGSAASAVSGQDACPDVLKNVLKNANNCKQGYFPPFYRGVGDALSITEHKDENGVLCSVELEFKEGLERGSTWIKEKGSRLEQSCRIKVENFPYRAGYPGGRDVGQVGSAEIDQVPNNNQARNIMVSCNGQKLCVDGTGSPKEIENMLEMNTSFQQPATPDSTSAASNAKPLSWAATVAAATVRGACPKSNFLG